MKDEDANGEGEEKGRRRGVVAMFFFIKINNYFVKRNENLFLIFI